MSMALCGNQKVFTWLELLYYSPLSLFEFPLCVYSHYTSVWRAAVLKRFFCLSLKNRNSQTLSSSRNFCLRNFFVRTEYQSLLKWENRTDSIAVSKESCRLVSFLTNYLLDFILQCPDFLSTPFPENYCAKYYTALQQTSAKELSVLK